MLKFYTTSDLFPARDLELRPAIPNFLPITSRSSHTANPWCGRMRIPSADSGLEFGAAAIRRAGAELGFDTQQAVVLRDAIGTAQRAGLNLARRRAHGQIGDSRILGFAGAMRNHCAVAGGLAILMASSVSVSDPIWLNLIRIELAIPRSIPSFKIRVLVTNRSSPTSWILLPIFWV